MLRINLYFEAYIGLIRKGSKLLFDSVFDPGFGAWFRTLVLDFFLNLFLSLVLNLVLDPVLKSLESNLLPFYFLFPPFPFYPVC